MNNPVSKEIKTVEIRIINGIHLRAASDVVNICKRHKSKVILSYGGQSNVEGYSILGLMMLGAGMGARVVIEAEGEDARQVIEVLSGYFSDGGGI